MNIKKLYKYRDLKDFRFFIDIILNNRLYAAAYTNLNDPMEGYYRYTTGEPTEEVLEQIKGEKQNLVSVLFQGKVILN